ncbi:MAG TPA: M13 family metallopeptidase [Longimicrobium sp.]
MSIFRSNLRIFLGCLALAGCAAAAVPSGTEPAPPAAGSASAAGRGIDPANMDPSCKPCEEFYRYANGGWLARNPIPADRSSWSSYNEVGDRTTATLHAILEEATARARSAPASLEGKLGAFYASCMDSARAEADGVSPVAGELARLAALRDRAALPAELARLSREMGGGVPFQLFPSPDDRDATRTIGVVWQGGLSLSSPEDYTRGDSASRALRDDYRRHVARMLVLAGSSEPAAEADAARVLEMETALARSSMTRVQMRDPDAIYHKLTLAELAALTPHLDWPAYLRALGAPAATELNVSQPEFMRTVDRLLAEAPMEQWSAFLRWHVLNDAAGVLSTPLADASFRFYSRFSGATQRQARWRRCVNIASGALGPALGRLYGERVFTPAARARAEEMIANLKAVLRDRIAGLAWMSPATRAEALRKADALRARLGYPDTIPDYAPLRLAGGGSFVDHLRAVAAFDNAREWAKIGKPTDASQWGTVPQRVSGVYDASRNMLTYPAAKFQPPFFDPEADDAVNYGALGSTIGHEISHGFDDEGRQYDAGGNRRDWWTADDAARFRARADRMVAQYDGYVAVDTVHVNGRLTLGENIADLGGVTLSYYALQRALRGKPRTPIDGLTPEQRFFISWAQNWRENARDAQLRTAARTDPHAPMRWRVVGPLSNLPEFARAFGCRPGDPMVRPDSVRVEIW